MQWLLDMPKRILQSFCREHKHSVLQAANPWPQNIQIYAGEKGSIGYDITMTVISSIPEVHLLQEPNETKSFTDDCFLRLDGEEINCGLIPALRYLGRIDLTMPVAPAAALVVDIYLTKIAALITHPPSNQQQLESALLFLEERFESSGMAPQFLGDLNAKSIADNVYYAAIKHVFQKMQRSFDWSRLPLTHEWYESITYIELVTLEESIEQNSVGVNKED